LEPKNGLVVFGIILLSAGLVASLYPEVKTLDNPYGQSIEISRTYPFQNLGIILVVAGITLSAIGLILSAIGFFYAPQERGTASP